MKYDLLEPSGDKDESINRLVQQLAPLYSESWYKEKAETQGNPQFDMNIAVFVNMWLSKAMRVFMAYDDNGNPVGYLLGMAFRPLTHNVQIFQIEDWYVKDAAPDGLFDYVYGALKFMGVDEIQVSHSPQEPYPRPPQNWIEGGSTYTDKWKKS